jgi:CBS domain-containing protein
MARYERDYGQDYGGRGFGGGRSEGWNRGQIWRGGFPGDEMWMSEPDSYGSEQYDRGFRNDQGYGAGMRGYQSGQSGYGEPGRGFGYTGRGNPGDGGYGGRDNYMEGWQDQRGGMGGGQTSGRRESASWNRPRASEIMTENPHVVTPDASISDVARKMRDLDVGIIPVVEDMEGRRLKGVITDRDITIRAVADGMGENARVSDCMTDRVRAVNKNDSVQDVMWVMRREQVRRVPVTDREGRLVGIIAQADLAVDYASDDRGRETEVGETLERISEPARPERNRMSASGRGDSDRADGATPRSRGRKSNEGN